MSRFSNVFAAGIGMILVWFAIVGTIFAGWLTHIVYCFENHQWLLLIAGAILAPIGVVHGWGLWFNFWH